MNLIGYTIIFKMSNFQHKTTRYTKNKEVWPHKEKKSNTKGSCGSPDIALTRQRLYIYYLKYVQRNC